MKEVLTMKLIGYENLDYVNKSGAHIEGARLYCTTKTNKIKGYGTRDLFLSKAKIERNNIDLDSLIDSEIVLIQNDFGSLSRIEKLVQND